MTAIDTVAYNPQEGLNRVIQSARGKCRTLTAIKQFLQAVFQIMNPDFIGFSLIINEKIAC